MGILRKMLPRFYDRGRKIPYPPLEMRRLVGSTEPVDYDNPIGELVFPHVPESAYEFVFDFGCGGCGRLARQLLQ